MKLFFGIVLVIVIGKPFSWEYLLLGGDWEPGGIENAEYRPKDYSLGFHVSHWNSFRRKGTGYGIEEGFRIKQGSAEFFFHVQGAVILKYFAVGASYGPVLRTTDKNPIDLELNLWTGTFLLLNLRLPSTFKFPANSVSNSPVIGLALTLPVKYPY